MKRWLLAATMLTPLPARAAPVAAAAAGVAAWYASIGVIGQLAVQIGVGLALTAASYGISYLLSGGGQRQSTAQAAQADLGVQITDRAGLLDRLRLYGRQTVAGGLFFEKTIAGTGTLDIFVRGYAISDGVCDGLEAIIINGTECLLDAFGNPLTAPWYNVAGNYLKVSFRSGLTTQPMDPIIAALWPSPPDDFYPGDAARIAKWANYKQGGVCTIVVEMNYGPDSDTHTALWGAGGIPDLKFRVRGLQVYDPRDSNQSPTDATTWKWSENAAQIEADWLTSDMGFGVDPSEIDYDSVKASADIDDFWVPTLNGLEKRGRIDGVASAANANDDTLKSMALQNRALIRRAFGKYSIRADSTRDPVCTIHQGLIVGALSYQNEPDVRSAINRAEMQFAPASLDNQSAETFYQDDTLIADDGQTLPQRLSLPFGDSPSQAQRLGYATVTENRAGRTLSGGFDISILIAAGKLNGQLLEAGDVARVDFPIYQQMNGLYTVTGIEIAQDFTVSVANAGYNPDVIDGWGVQLETPFEEAS